MIKVIRKGFSYFEVLLVVAMVAIATTASIPITRSFIINSELNVAVETSIQCLRRARMSARNSMKDSSWGVNFSEGIITIYSGESYDSRNSDNDEIYLISSAIVVTGDTDINFQKFTGDTSTGYTIVLDTSLTDETILNINSKGIIDY